MKRIAIALVLAAGCKDGTPDAPAAAPATPPAVAGPMKMKANAADRPALPDEPTAPPETGHDRWKDRKAKMDKDGDGVISDEEKAAARHERAQAMHDRFDKDGDGKLTPAELANPERRGPHFDDPNAVDTNHDGEISVDELDAAMQARRDQQRARRNGTPVGGDGSPP